MRRFLEPVLGFTVLGLLYFTILGFAFGFYENRTGSESGVAPWGALFWAFVAGVVAWICLRRHARDFRDPPLAFGYLLGTLLFVSMGAIFVSTTKSLESDGWYPYFTTQQAWAVTYGVFGGGFAIAAAVNSLIIVSRLIARTLNRLAQLFLSAA